MDTAHLLTQTPDGPFSVIAGPAGVLASGWTDQSGELLPLIHPELRPGGDVVVDSTGHPVNAETAAPVTHAGGVTPADEIAARAIEAVHAYYAGDPAVLAGIPVLQRSGPFLMRAWAQLRQIDPGSSLTYAQLAALSGREAAVRAAASACARNAAALFIPCHRVIRSDGTLGGFRYGLTIKASLLRREHDVGPKSDS